MTLLIDRPLFFTNAPLIRYCDSQWIPPAVPNYDVGRIDFGKSVHFMLQI